MQRTLPSCNEATGGKMKRLLIALASGLAGFAFMTSPAYAQSGHFIEKGAGAPTCTDIGTQLQCTGKVTGLGGTTFEITAMCDLTNP
jgi:hypothetical protein